MTLLARPIHFGPGPGILPLSVIQGLQEDLLSGYQGLSLLELGHRTEYFESLMQETETKIRALLAIPQDYHILMMHGGARAQFSAIPLYFNQGAYLLSGYWSEQAYAEAEALGLNPACLGDFRDLSSIQTALLRQDYDYYHYTDNETIQGVEYPTPPGGGSPDNPSHRWIADCSSSILTKKIDWPVHQMIYAAAQKNLGIAGITLVIISNSALERGGERRSIPSIMHYRTIAKSRSLYNTPPIFAWLVFMRMIDWAEKRGGIDVLAQEAQEKSSILYQMIDQSDLYQNAIDPRYRSRINVTFTIQDPPLQAAFLEEATRAGFWHLKGHSAVGGLRASLYVGLPVSDVYRLAEFMAHFERSQRMR